MVVIARASRGLVVMSVAGLISASLVCRPTYAYAKEDLGPMAKLRRTEAEIRAAVSRRVPDWSPEADMRRRQIERLLGGLLDYDSIASEALGAAFSKLALERRRDFLGDVRGADPPHLRHAAREPEAAHQLRQRDDRGQPGTRHRDGVRAGRGARDRLAHRVSAGAQRTTTGGSPTSIVDGTSLVATYKRQFRKLVAREGMDGLMVRMHDQLASADRPLRLEK